MGTALPALKRYQLFTLLGRLRSQEFTGTVIIHSQEGNTILRLEAGGVVGAVSEDIRLSFPAFLLRKRRLTRERLKVLLDQSERKAPLFETLLVKSRLVTEKEITRLKRELADFVFTSAFELDNAPYRQVPGEVAGGTDKLPSGYLDSHAGLFRAVLRTGDKDLLTRFFRDRWDLALEKTSDFYRYLMQARSVFFEEDITTNLMSVEPTPRKILDGSANKASALKALFALSYSGMLRFHGAAGPQVRAGFSMEDAIGEESANKTVMIVPGGSDESGDSVVGASSDPAIDFDSGSESDSSPWGGPKEAPVVKDDNVQDEFRRFFQEETSERQGEVPIRPAEPLSRDRSSSSLPSEFTLDDEESEDERGETLRMEDAVGPAPMALLLENESSEVLPSESVDDVGTLAVASAVAAETLPHSEQGSGKVGVASRGEEKWAPDEAMELEPAALDVMKKEAVEAFDEGVRKALRTPPPLPEKPENPEKGADHGIERILDDVYKAMLSRNLYEILGVTPLSPLSSVRDSAYRLQAKYAPEQYKGFMLSQRARTLLTYVRQEVARAKDVLCDRAERLVYDRAQQIQYPQGVQDYVDTLFEAEDLFSRARKMLDEKDFSGAKEALYSASMLNPQEPEYMALYGWVFYQLYNAGLMTRDDALKEASASINKALSVDARHVRSVLFMARIHKEVNEREEALSWYERLQKLDPTNEEAAVWVPELKRWIGPQKRAATPTGTFARFMGLFKKK